MKKGFFLLGLLVILGTVIFTTTTMFASSTPSSASKSTSGPHVFWKPGHNPAPHAAAAAGNLVYKGGSVMAGTTNVYAIFWEPNGKVSANYHSLIERYFNDVGSSSLYSNNNQYTQSNGGFPSNSRLAATWTDNGGYPNSPLLDADIQHEVSHAMSVNGWNSNNDNIFFVFTQSGADLCFDGSHSSCASNAFCAYHSAFGNGVIYAAMPYAASFSCGAGMKLPNNDDADLTINVTSHEQMEAATDNFPSSGWVDASGAEIGDKCAWNFGSKNADGSNVNWNGHPYLVQQEWDNGISGCTLVATNGGGGGPTINPNAYYKIVNQNSGKLIAVNGMSQADGAQVTQWNDNGSADHNWKFVDIGNGYYHIVNQNSGKLLAVSGMSNSDGANITQWSDSGTADHNWKLVSAGNGYYKIVNQNSSELIAVSGMSQADGAYLTQWNDNGSADHNWKLVQV